MATTRRRDSKAIVMGVSCGVVYRSRWGESIGALLEDARNELSNVHKVRWRLAFFAQRLQHRLERFSFVEQFACDSVGRRVHS